MTPAEFEDYKTKIIKIIEIFFPDAKIYLYGSRVRGDYDEQSDIDIAIDNGKKLPLTEHGQIISMIEHLNIPLNVDVVDFHKIPEEVRKNILKEGILWKG